MFSRTPLFLGLGCTLATVPVLAQLRVVPPPVPPPPVVVAPPIVAAPANPPVVAAPANPPVVAAPANPPVVAAPANPPVVAAPANPPVVAAPAPVLVLPAKPKFSREELINAASSGNLDRVKTIIAANPEFVNGTESQSPLGASLGNNQLEVARFLLESGADPNVGSWNNSPLSQVMSRSNDDKWKPLADLLVAKGADINGLDDSGQPLLFRTLQNGGERQKDRISWLLDHGANIYSSARGGASALDTAFSSSSVEIAKLILAKADIKRRDDLGQTPLFSAVRSGKIDIIRAVLERGAEINAQNGYGDTPLHVVTRAPVVNIELLKILLDAGANANLPNARADLPLHLALRREIALDRTFSLQNGDYPALANPNAVPRGLQLVPLIDKTDINKRDGGGFSPLLLAVIARDAESRDLIRDRAPKNDSTTQLFDAVAGGESLKVGQLLTAKPYLAYFRLPDGSTPLHVAALWGTLGSATELVRRGADINARDARGFTPLHNTLKNPTGRFSRRAINMTSFLLAKGAQPNIATPQGDAPLHLAARAGDAELVTLLLDKGAQINARGIGGETALLILTNRSTNIELYKTMLARKADVNARATGNYADGGSPYASQGVYFSRYSNFGGYGGGSAATPLHRAVVTGRADLISALLAGGANIEAPDTDGKTPLALAVTASSYGNQSDSGAEIATMLLAKGANPNVKIERGDLLSYAVERGNADLVRALLATKKVSLKSSARRTPLLFMAVQNGRLEVVRALLDAGADPLETDTNGRTPLQVGYSDEIKKLLTERIAAAGGTVAPATAAVAGMGQGFAVGAAF